VYEICVPLRLANGVYDPLADITQAVRRSRRHGVRSADIRSNMDEEMRRC
jgi:hypothetical protein